MRVQKINFTGYDARKLDGFVMQSNYGGVANAMTQIGNVEGFNVYFVNDGKDTFDLSTNSIRKPENYAPLEYTQDKMGIVGKKLLNAFENTKTTDAIKNHFNLKEDSTEKNTRSQLPLEKIREHYKMLINLPSFSHNGKKHYFYNDPKTNTTIPLPEEYVITSFRDTRGALLDMLNDTHVRGGNYFIVKNKSGEDELLLGKDELEKFSPEAIKKMFNTKKVHIIPQMDHSLDMFIRPLNNGKILIADDELTKKAISDGLDKIAQYSQKCIAEKDYETYDKLRKPFNTLCYAISSQDNVMSQNTYAKTDEVEKVLQDAGYETIRVPGRLYTVMNNPNELTPLYNFMNANVLLNDNNELVYITNDSIADYAMFGITPEIEELVGFSLKKSFFDVLGQHMDLKHAYTISGKNNTIAETLVNDKKGIHSMCAEVPERT